MSKDENYSWICPSSAIDAVSAAAAAGGGGIFLTGVLRLVEGCQNNNEIGNNTGDDNNQMRITYPIQLEISQGNSTQSNHDENDCHGHDDTTYNNPEGAFSLTGTISSLPHVKYPTFNFDDLHLASNGTIATTTSAVIIHVFIEGGERTTITQHSNCEHHVERTRSQEYCFVRYHQPMEIPIDTIMDKESQTLSYTFPITIPKRFPTTNTANQSVLTASTWMTNTTSSKKTTTTTTTTSRTGGNGGSFLPCTMKQMHVDDSAHMIGYGTCEIMYKFQAFVEFFPTSHKTTTTTTTQAIKYVSSIISPYIEITQLPRPRPRPQSLLSHSSSSSSSCFTTILSLQVGKKLRIPQMAFCGLLEIGCTESYTLNYIQSSTAAAAAAAAVLPTTTNGINEYNVDYDYHDRDFTTSCCDDDPTTTGSENGIYLRPGQRLRIKVIDEEDGSRNNSNNNSFDSKCDDDGEGSGGLFLLTRPISKMEEEKRRRRNLSIKVKFTQRIGCKAYDLQIRNSCKVWDVHAKLGNILTTTSSRRRNRNDSPSCSGNSENDPIMTSTVTSAILNVPKYLKMTYENGKLLQVTHDMIIYIVSTNVDCNDNETRGKTTAAATTTRSRSSGGGSKEVVVATTPILKVTIGP